MHGHMTPGETAEVIAARCPAEFLNAVPRDFCRMHLVLSQGSRDGAELLVAADGLSPTIIWNIGTRLGRPVTTAVMDREPLAQAIDLAYERNQAECGAPESPGEATAESGPADLAEEMERIVADASLDLLSIEGKAPIVRLVDHLLFAAVQVGASDLHFQPTSTEILVRRRLDGVLDKGVKLPIRLAKPLVSRIKVMAKMDVAERLMPQDGRATVRIGDRPVDLRLSTIPTAFGERVVARLLDASRQLMDLQTLGMPPELVTTFLTASRRSSGIILVTGPTGSGKTTTLYGTLRDLNGEQRNIVTIEDPIEYELSSLGLSISQSQVNARKGVNFANGLRHILRQDPDVIMVGEIRDAETARIAIQASLTGHLVFSTLHTNDAVSAIARLLDLGVEPFLVAGSLSMVLAQRLVRLVCTACHGAGCGACHQTGYRGRTGLFEALVVDDGLRRLISGNPSAADLRAAAVANGMRSLLQAGDDLVRSGRTTAEEIERVIHHA
jgi:general secretion pathway protein E